MVWSSLYDNSKVKNMKSDTLAAKVTWLRRENGLNPTRSQLISQVTWSRLHFPIGCTATFYWLAGNPCFSIRYYTVISKCDSWTTSISSTWKCNRNVNYQAVTHTTESKILALGESLRSGDLCFNKPLSYIMTSVTTYL